MRAVAKGIAGIAGVGAAAFAGTAAIEDNTTRNEAGEIVESGGLGAFQMQVGDCFNNGEETDSEFVASVEGVPCTQPHDNEVFAEFDVSMPSFPGDDALYEDAVLGCLDRFEAYVQTPYDTSVFALNAFTPTAEGWELDDREVTCFLFHWEGQKLLVSSKASRL